MHKISITSRPAPSKNEQLVIIQNDKTTTTSRKIAEAFGKSHKHILRDIEELGCSVEFGRLNFGLSSYKNSQNKKQPEYVITKDGFTMLAMGFTGAKAMQFKEAYIHAFNQMEEVVTKRMYGESTSITEVRKRVPNMAWKTTSKTTRLYKWGDLSRYLGYNVGLGSKAVAKYGHLMCTQNGVRWVDEDFLTMKIRNRTARQQQTIAAEAPALLPSNFGQSTLNLY